MRATCVSRVDNGRNDGFVESGSGPVAMGYWQQSDLPYYYSLAQVFPIADRYFASVLGQTFPNRRYLISATSIGQVNDTLPALTDYPANGTIFDRLDAVGVSWRDYYTTLPTVELYPALYLKNKGTKVVPITQFFTDAAARTLPGVPDAADPGPAAGGHPPERPRLQRERTGHHPTPGFGHPAAIPRLRRLSGWPERVTTLSCFPVCLPDCYATVCADDFRFHGSALGGQTWVPGSRRPALSSR
jgi:Phosphoesterase family